MPYIKNEYRIWLNEGFTPEDPGQLNYIITKICLDYLVDSGEQYQVYNDIIGALECCKLELYRRRIAPYEDKKIEENGDVGDA